MKLTAHIGISTVAAASVYTITGSQRLSLSLLLSGIFIDLDHVVDYVLLSEERFTRKNFFSWYDERRWNKIYIIFHSYELLAIFLLMTFWFRNDIMIGVAIGCSLHLLADQIGNVSMRLSERFSLWFYFFSYRYHTGFEKKNFLVNK